MTALAGSRVPKAARSALRWLLAIGGAVLIFGLLMVAKGVNPLEAYQNMWSSLMSDTSLSAVLVKGGPLVLAALAVTIPAKAGMVNVGGEGQLLMGGVFAAGMSQALGTRVAGSVALVLILVAGAIGGALWAGLAALLKRWVGISEAVTTLLLNYVALNVMFFLIYDVWKDPNGSGQPATRPIPVGQRLPLVGTSKVHFGIVIALVAAVGVWWLLRSTRFGFQLRVVGGNSEAARRAGLGVGVLVIGAMVIGGALAGLGGAAQLVGTEFKLRPGFLLTYGYIGFLASWLTRHDPLKVTLAALLLSAISISGDSLQIDSQLPAATVNILMALVLLSVFGFATQAKGRGMSLTVEVLAGGVIGGTSILYAAVGESFSESAGVVNLGTEGCMLVGALSGYAIAAETGNPWVGVAAGAAAGAVLALLHGFMVIRRNANQLATGLVVLFLGLGLTSLFGATYVSKESPGFDNWDVPVLSKIPALGEILFQHDVLTYISFALVPLCWWVLYRSRWGLFIRGVGERKEVLGTYGHKTSRWQFGAVVFGGVLAGVGGAQLSMAYAHSWFENMTQGRGFVACVVVIFAARNPFKVAAGAYLFGAALALSPALQARGYGVNQFALNAIPYLVIIAVLIVLGRKRATEAPEGLQAVFETAT